MTQVARICKYGCKAELGDFDAKLNKYKETDSEKTLHTKERCEYLKDKPKQDSNSHDISVDVLIKKLSSIGIEINLEKLRNV